MKELEEGTALTLDFHKLTKAVAACPGVIPVAVQHADTREIILIAYTNEVALKKAIATLKDGQVIGLFPEGTRSPDGQMRAAKGGIGFLIAKGDVPVVPLYISGTFAAFPKGADKFRPGRLVARFGPPIAPEEIRAAMPAKNDYEAVGALVMRRIRALAEET